MPDTVLKALYVVNPHKHPEGGHLYGPHFTCEEIESPQS